MLSSLRFHNKKSQTQLRYIPGEEVKLMRCIRKVWIWIEKIRKRRDVEEPKSHDDVCMIVGSVVCSIKTGWAVPISLQPTVTYHYEVDHHNSLHHLLHLPSRNNANRTQKTRCLRSPRSLAKLNFSLEMWFKADCQMVCVCCQADANPPTSFLLTTYIYDPFI